MNYFQFFLIEADIKDKKIKKSLKWAFKTVFLKTKKYHKKREIIKKEEKLLTFMKYMLYNKLSQGERRKYNASDLSA